MDTSTRPVAAAGSTAETLYLAARDALRAPSIFNSQPWLWRVLPDRLELRADRSRQLPAVDPLGRLMTLSCGVAAHHALVALGDRRVTLRLLPDGPHEPLMAVLHVAGQAPADRQREQMRRAIRRRRTDRRAFRKEPVDASLLDRLTADCHSYGAHLYHVPWNQMSALALAAVGAGALQLSEAAYRAELAAWTDRPPCSGDGVPLQTAVQVAPRRVPVRDFAPFGGDTLSPGLENDFGATYAIIHTDTDRPADWLAAGMALSAVLLTATAHGLGTATISDITEKPVIREHLRGLLPSGRPQVAVRIGHPQPGNIPAAPRRPVSEVVTIDPAALATGPS